MTDNAPLTPPSPAEPQPEAAPTQAPAATPETAQPAGSGRSTRGRVRGIMVGLVFFLACLSLVLATTTWWLHDTLLDTDHFVALTAPLATNPEVQEALVQVTTDQVDEALDLGPIGRYVVTGISREVYTSDAFAQLWERLMRSVHPRLVALLRGDSSFVQTSDGKVIVNLFPLLDAIFQRINALDIVIAGNSITAPTLTDPDDPDTSRAELSAALGRPLPDTFGTIPVADSAKLEAAQRYVTLFDALVVVLFIVTALLAVLAVALARHRVRMVALLGLGGLAALLAARLVVGSAADGLATAVAEAGPGAILGGEVVRKIADSYREFARGILLLSLAAAVVATAAAWYADRRASAEAAARGVTEVADGWFLALAGLSLALASLLVVGLTAVTLVVVAAAYVVWLVVLARWRRRATPAAAPQAPAA